MKRTIYILSALFITTLLNAQAPQSFSYQSIVKDSDGELVTERSIGVQITILKDTDDGVAVYTETHTVSTNSNGLLTLQIGEGTSTDMFYTIDWAATSHFVKAEMDLDGGTTYSISGTSQLLSVPYALHAKTVEEVPTSYSKMEIADTLSVGENGVPIMGVVELTGTTDATENYTYVNFPAGFDNNNCCVLSLQVYNAPFINGSSYFGLGYAGTNGTLCYELTYFQDVINGGAISRRLKINYPDELKAKNFYVVLMKYK